MRTRLGPVTVGALLSFVLSSSCGASAPKDLASSSAPTSAADDFALPPSYQQAAHPTEQKKGELVDRPPTPQERQGVEQLMKRAEKLRGLLFVQEIALHIQNRAAIKRYLKSTVDEQDLERDRRRLLALGLITPDEKLVDDKQLDEASKFVLGYYDPKLKYLAVTEDAASALATAIDLAHSVGTRRVVIHELVHALQDQHFDLEGTRKKLQTTDEIESFFALAEGDATLSELEYELERWGIEPKSLVEDRSVFNRLMTGGPPTVASAAIGPDIMQNPTVFRYHAGAMFCAQLWISSGGKNKEILNAAFRRRPQNTLTILQPQRYLDRWKPAKLPPLGREAFEHAGYAISAEDSLGQLDLGAYLSKGGVASDDIALEWTNDRLWVMERKGQLSAVWLVRLGDPSVVPRALELAKQVGEATQDTKHPVPFEAYGVGPYLLILRNVDPKVSTPIVQRFLASLD